jgi:hypothetical protein
MRARRGGKKRKKKSGRERRTREAIPRKSGGGGSRKQKFLCPGQNLSQQWDNVDAWREETFKVKEFIYRLLQIYHLGTGENTYHTNGLTGKGSRNPHLGT